MFHTLPGAVYFFHHVCHQQKKLVITLTK